MKKKFAMVLIILMMAGFSYSQTVQIDSRLEKAYNLEQLQRMQKDTPLILELLNYELDYSWYIESPEMLQKINDLEYLYYRDPETGEKAGKVESLEIGKVNIAEFYYDRPYDHRVFYRVGKTDTIIGFYSNMEMSEMFNATKGYSNE
ncbi:MAG: hypothetical protein HUK15_07245 [Bacteroidales bacterium]|nr:hypothetical protein [Bacteroidales bacterium]